MIATSGVWAKTSFTIDPQASSIRGSIRYTLIGLYQARFTEFSGTIDYDEKNIEQSQVQLTIETASLKSEFSRLDRIVVSPRLLDARRYPVITFKSHSISRQGDHLWAEGNVVLHGVKREFGFPFFLQGPFKDTKGNSYLLAKGRMMIRRKDFAVIWNKILDQGGLIVGDHVNVDWKVTAREKNLR